MVMQVEFLAGTSLGSAIKQSKSLINNLELAIVEFSFNGVEIVISKNSDEHEVYKIHESELENGR